MENFHFYRSGIRNFSADLKNVEYSVLPVICIKEVLFWFKVENLFLVDSNKEYLSTT